MTDIVERLRIENSFLPYYGPPKLQIEAADEIERLRADADFKYMHGYESAKSDYRDQLIESEAEIERLKDGEARLRAALEGAAVQFANNNLPAFSHQCRAALKKKT
jgi:hypothetical protein